MNGNRQRKIYGEMTINDGSNLDGDNRMNSECKSKCNMDCENKKGW